MKLNTDKLFDILINKAHVALAVITQGVILYLDRTGHAIGPSTQQTVNWFYLFLAGHFGASQVWPDRDGQPPAGGSDAQQSTTNASGQ